MIHIMHFMQILKLSDEVIKTYGRFPDERAPGLQNARMIYKTAFGELIRQGMPHTKEADLIRIETDGEVYAIHEYDLTGMRTAPDLKERIYAVHTPAPTYATYAAAHTNDDEDLDETKVMSFTEAMSQKGISEAEGQETMDEEPVYSANDFLYEVTRPGHEDKRTKEEDLTKTQESTDESLKQPFSANTPEGAEAPDAHLGGNRTNSWEPADESYKEPAEEPADESYKEPAEEDYGEPIGEPEDIAGENDGIIIPPEDNEVMVGPNAADKPGEQEKPETYPSLKEPDQEYDKGNEDMVAISGEEEAKKPALPIFSAELQDALQKDDFTYSNGRLRITAPNDAEENAGIMSMPLSMDKNPPEFILYCAVGGRGKRTFVLKGQGETVISVAGYNIIFNAWFDEEGKYKTSCQLDKKYASIGVSLSYKVKKITGKKGHIVLGDDEGTLRIHAMPTSFKDTEKGEPASMLYYVESADTESFGVSNPQEPILFPYGDGRVMAGFIWKYGTLNAGIIQER